MITNFSTYIFEAHEEIDPYNEERWDEVNIKDLFMQFLKNDGVYYRYIENLKDPHWAIVRPMTFDEIIDRIDPGDYIFKAFRWPFTKEGSDFWEDIDDKWSSLLRENGIYVK